MSVELLVNVTPQETRVAVIENGMLQEVFVERARKRGLVGNIYKGRVMRVLPGMQASFVDIGLERAAFLHASDCLSSGGRTPVGAALLDPPGDPAAPARAAASAPPGTADPPRNRALETAPESIAELLSEGQTVLVQVVKDPLGTKGARLTMHISIPSCYLVFVPYGRGVGISQRIEEPSERERLKTIVNDLTARGARSAAPVLSVGRGAELAWAEQEGRNLGKLAVVTSVEAGARATRVEIRPEVRTPPPLQGGGYIVRTAAESVDSEKLAGEVRFLGRLWSSITRAARNTGVPGLVHEELPLVVRTLRELAGTEIEKVRIDSRETYRRVLDFTEAFTPELEPRVQHYPGERPVFDLYGVEDELQKALERRVDLKSGGYLIIDQTEAMTTIDVNTGAYVGRRNLDETIFKTNLEAAHAIARQLRLRNLGGIIIIDFIDMRSEEHKRQVLRALERSLEKDQMKTQISEVSALGLVQMTRKRTRESLEHVLCEPCPTCNGRGIVKSPETVCYEIFREILREARQYDAEQLLVLASEEVIERLVDEESAGFAELEAFIGRPIRLQVEPMYTQGQYDVVLT